MAERWLITDPDGNEFEISNLSAFAKELGCDPETLRISSTRKPGYARNGYRAVKLDANL